MRSGPEPLRKASTIEERGGRDALIDADPLRVKEMLYNLLSNAVKFTPKGGRVWIETAEDADFVRLTVGDTGIGISAEEQENIFDKFYQVGNTTSGRARRNGAGSIHHQGTGADARRLDGSGEHARARAADLLSLFPLPRWRSRIRLHRTPGRKPSGEWAVISRLRVRGAECVPCRQLQGNLAS